MLAINGCAKNNKIPKDKKREKTKTAKIRFESRPGRTLGQPTASDGAVGVSTSKRQDNTHQYRVTAAGAIVVAVQGALQPPMWGLVQG